MYIQSDKSNAALSFYQIFLQLHREPKITRDNFREVRKHTEKTKSAPAFRSTRYREFECRERKALEDLMQPKKPFFTFARSDFSAEEIIIYVLKIECKHLTGPIQAAFLMAALKISV